jgi:hypothetical protein
MPRALLRLAGPACSLLLAGCLATPPAAPPVVSSSERRGQYQGALSSVVVLAPAAEAQRSPRTALYAELDTAMRRQFQAAGVPAAAWGTDRGATLPSWSRNGPSHLVRISLPAVAEGRAALQVELRDTLTRSVVWRYAGELDTAARPSPQQVAERMVDAVLHRLREDGLLAR